MPDDVERTVSDRVAALIEECRREREACAEIRARILAYNHRFEATVAVVASRAAAERDSAASRKSR